MRSHSAEARTHRASFKEYSYFIDSYMYGTYGSFALAAGDQFASKTDTMRCF